MTDSNGTKDVSVIVVLDVRVRNLTIWLFGWMIMEEID
jgi:hypothetical protein